MSARNETTGVEYQKGNVIRLLNAELEHGYDHNRGWAGYKQWLGAGRVVRKGEHHTACLTVVTVEGADGKRGTRPRGFRVFHYDQTEELATMPLGDVRDELRTMSADEPTAAAKVDAMVTGLVISPEAVEAVSEPVYVASRAARFGMVRDPGEDMADRWSECNY